MPLPTLALERLRRELRKHPDIDSHVARTADIEKMSKPKLTTLARKLGIDAKAIINKAIVDDLIEHAKRMTGHLDDDERERWNYSHRYPAFNGIYEFDLTIETLGEKVTRRAQALYQHTPEWEYYDLRKKEPYVGWEGTQLSLKILTVPDRDAHYHKDDPLADGPIWIKLGDLVGDGLMSDEMWDSLYDAIDEQCKAEDAERRRAAGATPSENGLH